MQSGPSETNAALEFAVNSLEVSNLLMCIVVSDIHLPIAGVLFHCFTAIVPISLLSPFF